MLPTDSDIDVTDARSAAPKPVHLRWAFIGLVAVGGMVGTAAREALVLVIPPLGVIPIAIFAINITGALFLGALLESLARRGTDEGGRRTVRLLVGTGFAGGFTTYSSFAVDAAILLSTGFVGAGIAYAVGTILAGAAATFVGIATASALHRRSSRSSEGRSR